MIFTLLFFIIAARTSEDSDYTSDRSISYPPPHLHNSSAHQYPLHETLGNYYRDRDRERDPRYDSFDGGGSFDRGGSFDNYDPEESFDSRNQIYDIENADSFEQGPPYEPDEESLNRDGDLQSQYSDSQDDRDYNRDYLHEQDSQDYEPELRDFRDDDDRYDQQRNSFDSGQSRHHNNSFDSGSVRQQTSFDSGPVRQQNSFDSGPVHQQNSFDSVPGRNYPEGQGYGRENYPEGQGYGRERDYYQDGFFPTYGKSDTDSDLLSYNSRPNDRSKISNILAREE